MLGFQDCFVWCSMVFVVFIGGARVCFHGFCVPADNLRSSDNYIGDDGAAALCTTLERNTTLQSLDLSGECMRVKRFGFCGIMFDWLQAI